jgi:dipeptidyl aminopeptidase/acylaminoacyl peptidase
VTLLLKSGDAVTAPLRPDDIYHFRWIDHVRLSPDGERIAYQLGWADAESRSNRSRVVVRRVLDPEPVEATAGARRDHSPEWSPDGRSLAFVSKRGAADQVFVLDLPGSEPVQVSSLPEGAGSPAWSPDASHVAFLGTVVSDREAVVDDPRPPEGADQVRRTPVARVARTLDYKHDGGGFVDGRHEHLFIVSAQGGEATQLTDGPWSVGGIDWSPDGTRLAVVGNADADSDLHRESHLYSVDFTGTMDKVLTGYDLTSPKWSPRGDLIAYVGLAGEDPGGLERLWVVAATGGEARCLTTSLDLSVGDSLVTDMRAGHGVRICWSRAGDRLYFTASGPGVTGLYSVDLDGNVRAEVGGQRRIYDFDVANGVIAFCASEPSDPGELHVVMQGAEARLTDLNPWLRDRFIAQAEEHSFTATDGWVLQGWMLKPPGFDPTRSYPLVMEVHGGPHAEYGWAFFHELQILAGMGYLVFYVNPRGSDGYGEVFRRAVVRDWGGKDYLDLMTALDQVIQKSGGFIDTSRMGIGGGSYGGYMTNWAIGQTDRFAAAVAMRSLSNLVSEYAQHDIVLWGQLEIGSPPWPDSDELWRRSPIRYVNNVKTPLLLTCGEMDLRCAISQSEEMFGALRLLGKTVEMVRFPEEAHDISRSGRPDRRVERLSRIAGWYERFLGTATADRVAPPEPAAEPEPASEPEPQPVEIGASGAMAGEPEAAAAEPEEAAIFEPEALGLVTPVEEVPAEEADDKTLAEAEPAAEATTAEPVAEAEADEVEPRPEAVEAISPEPEDPSFNPPVIEPEPAAAEVQPVEAIAETVADTAPPAAEEGVAATLPPEPSPAMEAAEAPVPEAQAVPDVAETVPPEPATQLVETMHVQYPPSEVAQTEPAPLEAPAPSAEPVPSWDQAPERPGVPTETWDEAPAAQPSAPTWDAAPQQEPAAAPTWDAAPAQAAAQAQPQPVAPGAPNPIASTMIAWPAGTAGGDPANGVQSSEAGGTEATSIMPAWQPAPTAATKETLALHTVQLPTSAEAPAKLTFETGPFASRVVGIPDQSATVGRAPDNDIIIGDPATSGRHCRIEVRAGAYWISDLGSTNGTLVNGEPIIDKQLEHGDVISIGQNTIRFTLRS